MKINSINLSWFRGAANPVALETDSKSVVIYGTNGSGKSTFVDAIEYIVNEGKIKHLSHEYSGSRQETAIRNTHAPVGEDSLASLYFQVGDHIDVGITPSQAPIFDSDPPNLIKQVQSWRLERLLLRQDEVANFVHFSKTQKYNVLFPLLGLEGMEEAAKNFHELQPLLQRRSDLDGKTDELNRLVTEAGEYFSDLSPDKVMTELIELAKTYVGTEIPEGYEDIVGVLKEAIKKKIDLIEPDNTRYILLKQIHDEILLNKLNEMVDLENDVKGQVDTLLDHKIAVLERASAFATRLGDEDEDIECPACGQSITVKEFVDHVRDELQAMKDVCLIRKNLKTTRGNLAASLQQVLKKVKDDNVSAWLKLSEQKELLGSLNALATLDLNRSEEGWESGDMAILNKSISIVVSCIESAIKVTPRPIKRLIGDMDKVLVAEGIPQIHALDREIKHIQEVLQALNSSETALRDSIKFQTKEIIQTISVDVQYLWSKLHPNEPIEDIKLYVPRDADKAIDIGLKFYGIDQPSPRVTLSEGHRNSLGLCIFLALARLDGGERLPIILDDIVSSLDRQHRCEVADVLLNEFTDRQVLLFTHDREWYQELRSLLPQKDWKFLVLRPWESPEMGIRWSESKDTFDDARSLIDINPGVAGNQARQIMDTQFAIASERLKISLPYLRGDRNDHRTCIEFIQQIISEAKERLKIKDNGSWVQYLDPINDWQEARRHIIAFANRGSHTGSLTSGEVGKLIEVCEKALGHFLCESCDNYIWIADQAGKRTQCECGNIRWNYGKKIKLQEDEREVRDDES